MINDVKLLLTRQCNLNCDYCFAKNFRNNNQEPLNMSLDTFNAILDWCKNLNINHINLLGGEPTLHPQFEDILYQANASNMNITILSNAINIGNFINKFSINTSFLLNINSKNDIGDLNYKKMLDNLDIFYNLGYLHNQYKTTLGFNIYNTTDAIDNMFFIIDKYHLNQARVSICSPINLNISKELYYSNMKQTVLDITKRSIERHITLSCDCSVVPPCYFTSKELLQIQAVWGNYSPICGPICAINTAGTIIPCFSNSNYDKMLAMPRKFFEFTIQEQLEDYINRNMMHNNLEGCIDCPKALGCINGCGGC